MRLASGRLTVEEATAFRLWHAASATHARAFAEAKQQWGLVGAAAQELAREAAFATDRRRLSRPMSRRCFLGAGAAAAAAGIGAVVVRPPFDLWSPLMDFSADYHTAIGETQTIAMADNVIVQLSTRSRLALQSDLPVELRVALLSGEAAVISNSRPVTVVAGSGEARAVSGRFNLRNDDGIVRVTCVGGAVDVSCGDQQTTLRGNQQIRYSARGLGSTTAADVDEITAWQRGVLVFRNQPLRYVLDEVNRYRSGKIILLNPELGNRPVVVASFYLDRLDEIFPQVEALYGAKIRHLPGGIVLLS